jgi:hypothetical protein
MNSSNEKDSEFDGLKRVLPLSASTMDPLARAFVGEKRLLIGFDRYQQQTIERLLNEGVIAELDQRGLIATTRISDQELPNASLTLEHDIDLSSRRPRELSPSMYKDAALVIIDVALVLDRYGYILTHIESNHLGFDANGRPKFIALGMIRSKGTHKFPYSAFVSSWLGPLTVLTRSPELGPMVRRSGSVDRQEMLTLTHPYCSSLLSRMKKWSLTRRIAEQFHRILVLSPFGALIDLSDYSGFLRNIIVESNNRKKGKESVADWTGPMLVKLRNFIESFKISASREKWSGYQDDYSIYQIAKAEGNWRQYFKGPRPEALLGILEQEQATTLLDIGANQGYFSLMAANLGFRTTALDYDGRAIDSLYHALKDTGNRFTICPGVVDFIHLNPFEWGRFRSDVTLALGFTHHMRLVEMLSWEQISEVLAGVTERILVTEFKDGTGARASHVDVSRDLAEDYRIENFTTALSSYFTSVEVLGEFAQAIGGSGRNLIVCRK